MPQAEKPTPRQKRGDALLLVGVDHHGADLALRERVTYANDAAEDILVQLLTRPEIAEAALLSTCNRTELYLRWNDEKAALQTALATVFAPRAPELVDEGRYFVCHGQEAVRHLLAVASGTESMVLGEPEILGQVRQAGSLASSTGTTGAFLDHLFRSAALTGRRVRSETAIGAGAVSLGSAVVELAANIFNGLDGRRALLLGAGDTARLMAHALTDRGLGNVIVTNRTEDRLNTFVESIPGLQPAPWTERLRLCAESDLVAVATGAPEPILRRMELASVMRRRQGRPLLVADLAVPRNVDPTAAGLDNLFLHPVDSLQGLIQQNLEQRRREVGRVQEIVDEEVTRFTHWYHSLDAEPIVAALQKRAERIRQRELQNALARFPDETHEDLERLTRALVRKILHHPSTTLRSRGEDSDLAELDMARRLFRLGEDLDSDD
jgi:glutamyl-tRNA reductase